MWYEKQHEYFKETIELKLKFDIYNLLKQVGELSQIFLHK